MKTEIQAGFVPPEALEWTRANYGISALSVHERAISMLRAQAQNPASMKLDVNGGAYSFNGVTRLFAGGQSPEFTAPASGTRLDILYLNGATGALAIQQGTAAIAITDPLELPDAPVGAIPLVAVHLAAGQESITESDLYDLRALFNSVDSALIANATITSAVSSVTFSSIPSDFETLVLTGMVRTDRAAKTDYLALRFNGDTGNNYDRSAANVAGGTWSYSTTRAGDRLVLCNIEGGQAASGAFSPVFIQVPAYTAPVWKACASGVGFNRGNADVDADVMLRIAGGVWRSTAAITSITLFPHVGTNFAAGTRFYLWGCK